MIAYFDTSAFVKLVVPERGSAEAAALWASAERLVSSQLLYIEARAAVARAFRVGRLDRRRLPIARRLVERLWRDLGRLDVTEALARKAGELADGYALRAYDAVHLASLDSIADTDTVLVAADGELIAAARARGLTTAPL